MSPRTSFLSRLIGLYCLLIALSMITHRQAIVETVKALLYEPTMMFVLGVITLGAVQPRDQMPIRRFFDPSPCPEIRKAVRRWAESPHGL